MTLIFTPLGIRGIFGDGIDSVIVEKIANIFGRELGKGSLVVVGRDTRPSGYVLDKAVVSGLLSAGVNVLNIGIAPTPTIEWAVERYDADGGIIISASHNPPEWNALKLIGRGGLLLHPDDMERLRERFEREEFRSVPWNDIGMEEVVDVTGDYLEDLLNFVSIEVISEAGFKVVLDVNGGAGAYVTPYLFQSLGCKVNTLNSSPGIFVREMEPRPDTLRDLSKVVVSTGADVGFAHDTDADRLTLVTESGEVLSEDITLALVVDYILERRGGGSLVVNVASSKMFDDIARRRGAKIYRTPVGEAYVAHKMREIGATVGGEGSCGGVILPDFHMGRDGPLAAALILEIMASKKRSISELVSELPKYHTISANFPTRRDWSSLKRDLISLGERRCMEIDLTDGVRLSDLEVWGLIRPSKTEPKIRVL
ncbi:MAG: phosphoglucosamine mutase, partial [Candidatus Korarchaeota archaeon]|nr:phosphoglucosamine mutase [Candidatus Korarchaeota archaeon]